MTEVMTAMPLATIFDALTSISFWTTVGILAGIYTLVALGLQLNVGYTGIVNFGAAGFMAIGAYSMAILSVDTGISFYLALPISILITVAFGLLVGLPSLRLREDYLAIATIAMAEVVRLVAVNARGLTNGTLGFSCSDDGSKCFDETWLDISGTIEGWLESLGWSNPEQLFPLFLVVWVAVILVTLALVGITETPWGRVLRAIREDEDAARALGKNAFAYKLQSLAISAAVAAVAGWFLALNIAAVAPTEFEPLVTFFAYAVLILGGLASYWGLIIGSVILWTLLELTRYISDVPVTGWEISGTQQASLRFAIVGLVLILLMAFRPQGAFGKREELVLGE
jgi:branched-chain amino acid transport system permease protein